MLVRLCNRLTARLATKPAQGGTLLALIGILILTPDTLMIRLSNLERWSLVGWRGILMGLVLLLIWYFLSHDMKRDWRSLGSWPGLVIMAMFSINSITFTLGIVETSVTLVLTAVATMPLFAALLSAVMFGERQDLLGWATIMAVMAGVVVVVLDGDNAVGIPNGSVLLGAFYGILTALGLAIIFTMTSKYPTLGVLPAASLGSLASGFLGMIWSDLEIIMAAPVIIVGLMGLFILPVSFACLVLAPRYTSATIVSLIMLLEMVIGPFWVWLGVGERPTLTMVAGVIFVSMMIAFHILRTQWFVNHDKIPKG